MLFARLRHRLKEDEKIYDETIQQAIAEEERLKSKKPQWGWGEDKLIDLPEGRILLSTEESVLLDPVLSRARCSEAAPDLFEDQAACRIARYFDRDISSELPDVEDYLEAFKQYHFIKMAKVYLELFPRAYAIDLGCGLSTLRQQLDNKTLKWINIDTEANLGARGKLGLDRKERSKNIACDPFGYDWVREVQYKQDRGCVFFLEAPLISRSAHAAKQLLSVIKDCFPGAFVMFSCQTRRVASGSTNFQLYTINAQDVFHSWFDDPSVRVYSKVLPPKDELSLCTPKSIKRPLKRAFKQGSQILVDIRF